MRLSGSIMHRKELLSSRHVTVVYLRILTRTEDPLLSVTALAFPRHPYKDKRLSSPCKELHHTKIFKKIGQPSPLKGTTT